MEAAQTSPSGQRQCAHLLRSRDAAWLRLGEVEGHWLWEGGGRSQREKGVGCEVVGLPVWVLEGGLCWLLPARRSPICRVCCCKSAWNLPGWGWRGETVELKISNRNVVFIVDFWDSTSHNDYESSIEAVIMRGQDNALCMQYWRESTS